MTKKAKTKKEKHPSVQELLEQAQRRGLPGRKLFVHVHEIDAIDDLLDAWKGAHELLPRHQSIFQLIRPHLEGTIEIFRKLTDRWSEDAKANAKSGGAK
jgi:hypothetical protein